MAERRREGGEDWDDSDQTEVKLILADGTTHGHPGKVVAADAAINPNTGTFTLEADFPNPDAIVIAGQFARARIPIETREDALLVPQRAVSELLGNFRVFVVDGDGKVTMRAVELGPQVGRLRVVTDGLKVGERVAVEGLLTLREGVTVQPKVVDFEEHATPDTEKQATPDVKKTAAPDAEAES
jgi:membrane fusion protein (multidrug efflux system)